MSSLKEQNGRYYREVEVVMLATDKGSKFHLFTGNKPGLYSYNRGENVIPQNPHCINQHLYFLSDDEPKVNDWVLNTASSTNRPFQIDEAGVKYVKENKTPTKKIITTTDETLVNKWIGSRIYDSSKGCEFYGFKSGVGLHSHLREETLPRPSDSFIRKYIEEYNAGRQITDVLVEYERGEDINDFGYFRLNLNLKVDSNNTIMTTKLKDSYSRDELIKFVSQAFEEGYSYSDYPTEGTHMNTLIKNWIKENL